MMMMLLSWIVLVVLWISIPGCCPFHLPSRSSSIRKTLCRDSTEWSVSSSFPPATVLSMMAYDYNNPNDLRKVSESAIPTTLSFSSSYHFSLSLPVCPAISLASK